MYHITDTIPTCDIITTYFQTCIILYLLHFIVQKFLLYNNRKTTHSALEKNPPDFNLLKMTPWACTPAGKVQGPP